jgi:hypothetical protein
MPATVARGLRARLESPADRAALVIWVRLGSGRSTTTGTRVVGSATRCSARLGGSTNCSTRSTAIRSAPFGAEQHSGLFPGCGPSAPVAVDRGGDATSAIMTRLVRLRSSSAAESGGSRSNHHSRRRKALAGDRQLEPVANKGGHRLLHPPQTAFVLSGDGREAPEMGRMAFTQELKALRNRR